MLCPNCFEKVEEYWKQCPNCGLPLRQSAESPFTASPVKTAPGVKAVPDSSEMFTAPAVSHASIGAAVPEQPRPVRSASSRPLKKKRRKGGSTPLIIALACVTVLAVLYALFGRSLIARLADSNDGEDPYVPESAVIEMAGASSTRPPMTVGGVTYSYEASNLIDGNLNTAWVEGEDGSTGASFILFLEEYSMVEGIIIWNGYWRTPDTMADNSRAKLIEVFFDDGAPELHKLYDPAEKEWSIMQSDGGEVIYFSNPRATSVLTIVIEEAYDGISVDGDYDLCISEVIIIGTVIQED